MKKKIEDLRDKYLESGRVIKTRAGNKYLLIQENDGLIAIRKDAYLEIEGNYTKDLLSKPLIPLTAQFDIMEIYSSVVKNDLYTMENLVLIWKR